MSSAVDVPMFVVYVLPPQPLSHIQPHWLLELQSELAASSVL